MKLGSMRGSNVLPHHHDHDRGAHIDVTRVGQDGSSHCEMPLFMNRAGYSALCTESCCLLCTHLPCDSCPTDRMRVMVNS